MQLHFTNREYEPGLYSLSLENIYMYPRNPNVTPIIKFAIRGYVCMRPGMWFTKLPHSTFIFNYPHYEREVFS